MKIYVSCGIRTHNVLYHMLAPKTTPPALTDDERCLNNMWQCMYYENPDIFTLLVTWDKISENI